MTRDESLPFQTQQLLEIKDNTVGKVVLTGISDIIHSYGSRLFFIRNHTSLISDEKAVRERKP